MLNSRLFRSHYNFGSNKMHFSGI